MIHVIVIQWFDMKNFAQNVLQKSAQETLKVNI